MKMPLTLFPADIIEYYKLMGKALNGYVYTEIRKGMCGLPQAVVLANKLLKERLVQHGYFEQPHTPGLWKQVSRPVWFNLCVDDFRIKYIGREHLQQYTMHYKRKHRKLLKIWKVTFIVALP